MAAAAVASPLSWAFGSVPPDKTLRLYNAHTEETLDVTYYRNGSYDFESLGKINYLMRCHYTGELKPIDVRVLDLLCGITDSLGRDGQIEIISGYRSFTYNEYLRTRSRNVARDSYHMKGLAVDFTVSGIRNNALARTARSFNAGGVGEYREFVHIDVGPVRSW